MTVTVASAGLVHCVCVCEVTISVCVGRERKTGKKGRDRIPLQFRVNGQICKLMTSGTARKPEFNVANYKTCSPSPASTGALTRE